MKKAAIKLCLIAAFFYLLTACVSFPISHTQPSDDDYCGNFYSQLDKLVYDAKVQDAQAVKLKEYPFLSVNRFLVSFKNELDNNDKFTEWLEQSASLNKITRSIEWNNLSLNAKQQIKFEYLQHYPFSNRLNYCSSKMRENVKLKQKSQIIAALQIEDNYSTASRILGAYAITSMYVTAQINKHHALEKESFNIPLEDLSVSGKLQSYGLPPIGMNKSVSKNIQKNVLNTPVYNKQQLDVLFAKFAPVLEINEEDFNDKIGKMIVNNDSKPELNLDQPTYYVLPSYARFQGKILLQLNYVFWFPARPVKSILDIYAGKFDGIMWRVTLDKNHEPIIFESVHACGCYHKVYATDSVSFKDDIASKEPEPIFLAQKLKIPKNDYQTVLRIGSVSHFIQRVYFEMADRGEAHTVGLLHYDSLRSLPNKNKFINLFSPSGIVNDTERAERWLLWPMGVESAGAMRQWGNHAIAFVGRRHYDDPYLLEKYFSWP